LGFVQKPFDHPFRPLPLSKNLNPLPFYTLPQLEPKK
jgi:hypothetical protein